MVKTEEQLTTLCLARLHLEMLEGTVLQMAWDGWRGEGGMRREGGRVAVGFKFKQKIKHRQDHPGRQGGREVGSNICQMLSN